jgi:hypothetical protein
MFTQLQKLSIFTLYNLGANMTTVRNIIDTFESTTSHWSDEQKLEWLEYANDRENPEPDESEALYIKAHTMLEIKYSYLLNVR